MTWSFAGQIDVGPLDKNVLVGPFLMEPEDDTIWIKITQTSPSDVWTYSYGLLTWRTVQGQELGTIKVYGDTDSEVFALGVGLPPSERYGDFIFTPRAYNRRWISIDSPPIWSLSFEAQSGKANDGPPVFGTRATLGVLADLVDIGVSYAFGNSPAGTVARISLKALSPNRING